MRLNFIFLYLLSVSFCFAQTNTGNTFSGEKSSPATQYCSQNKGAFTDDKVNALIQEILSINNLKNRFIIQDCPAISNCQAVYFEGKPYILYNASFLEEVKSLSFSEKVIVTNDRNWEALTILAHEIGHHFNNHLNNPLPGATTQSLELEADEYAGYIIYMMGGSLSQAQRAYRNISETPSYTHPARSDRMKAIEKGYRDGEKRSPRGNPPSPSNNVVTNNVSSVKIGNQEWMTQNLNVDLFQNRDPIPEAKTAEEWKRAGENNQPAWCYYNYNPANGAKYGKLYNWYAVMDSRGLAPEGWHVPNQNEWIYLINYLGGENIAGSKLKTSEIWSDSNYANNESGFHSMPSGYCNNQGKFHGINNIVYWWSTTEGNPISIWDFGSNISFDLPDGYINNLDFGFSVRCLKD